MISRLLVLCVLHGHIINLNIWPKMMYLVVHTFDIILFIKHFFQVFQVPLQVHSLHLLSLHFLMMIINSV